MAGFPSEPSVDFPADFNPFQDATLNDWGGADSGDAAQMIPDQYWAEEAGSSNPPASNRPTTRSQTRSRGRGRGGRGGSFNTHPVQSNNPFNYASQVWGTGAPYNTTEMFAGSFDNTLNDIGANAPGYQPSVSSYNQQQSLFPPQPGYNQHAGLPAQPVSYGQLGQWHPLMYSHPLYGQQAFLGQGGSSVNDASDSAGFLAGQTTPWMRRRDGRGSISNRRQPPHENADPNSGSSRAPVSASVVQPSPVWQNQPWNANNNGGDNGFVRFFAQGRDMLQVTGGQRVLNPYVGFPAMRAHENRNENEPDDDTESVPSVVCSPILAGMDFPVARNLDGYDLSTQSFNRLPESEDDFADWDRSEFEDLGNPRAARTARRTGKRFETRFHDSASPRRSAAPKRAREKSATNISSRQALKKALEDNDVVSACFYQMEDADPMANDVWPNIRDSSKAPARYYNYHLGREDQEGWALPPPLKGFLDSIRPNKILRLKVKAPADKSLDSAGEDSAVPQTAPKAMEPKRVTYPPGALPTELYEEIASYLSRDDIKAMRLTCREFDQHVAQVLFKTVVVPFNTEIYGMLGSEQKLDLKGKKKVKADNNPLPWKNENGDDVYNGHGLDVFKGFGPHILRFGMSFDVNEDALAKPPKKTLHQNHVSFWGSYEWPYEEYRRFDAVAGLEIAADETPRMKIAFSMLQKVQELALSVNSGLGWLHGPDKSIRTRVLRKAAGIFGSSNDIPDRKSQAQEELWSWILNSHYAAGSDVRHATLYRLGGGVSLSDLGDLGTNHEEQPAMPFLDPHLIHEAIPHDFPEVKLPDLRDPEALKGFVEVEPPSPAGLIFTSTSAPSDAAQCHGPLIPEHLTNSQLEWLLETDWAQRAFLSSYMLAVIDNPTTFAKVHTLNISQLSSRYTMLLCRDDFWNALPGLRNVILQSIPDWRTVYKNEAGFVNSMFINPSYHINSFYQLLKTMVATRANIKNLTIGWAAGGEHAEGLHARNKHILPAPVLMRDYVLDPQYRTTTKRELLAFPHVEKLTLKNCWMTPFALRKFVRKHDGLSLEHLTLESFSLSAMPRTGAHQNNNHGIVQHGPIPVPPLHAIQNIAGTAHQIQQTLAQGGPGIGQNPAAVAAMLQVQIQNLQAQHNAPAQHQLNQLLVLQAQLQAHLNAQGHGGGAGAANAAPGAPAAQQPDNPVRMQHREGSWPYILDIISPGDNLGDLGSTYSRASDSRNTKLKSIALKSCGYVRLPNAQVDMLPLDSGASHFRSQHFARKYTVLGATMMTCKDTLMGEILQEVESMEVVTMQAAWDIVPGWEDEDEAAAVEFDGLAKGGTGRFTGVIRAKNREQSLG